MVQNMYVSRDPIRFANIYSNYIYLTFQTIEWNIFCKLSHRDWSASNYCLNYDSTIHH